MCICCSGELLLGSGMKNKLKINHIWLFFQHVGCKRIHNFVSQREIGVGIVGGDWLRPKYILNNVKWFWNFWILM